MNADAFYGAASPTRRSWLNAAELEASLVSRECLGRRRIPDMQQLTAEVEAWALRADADRRSINWTFRVDDARRVFCYTGITTLRSER